MKIKISGTAGFCMGVRRAVDLAVEHASQRDMPVLTLGPLIHNNQTIEMLRERGVKTLDGDDPAPGSAKILVRAHGIPPSLQNLYAEKGHIIIDGTCPKVKTVHKVIEKYRESGYQIVIAGDKGHAEVIGLSGYAGDAGHLIQSPEDAASLPDMEKVCFVSQTTFDRETFDAIAGKLKERFKNSELIIKRTICSATDKRQRETREMAKCVDAMIVVGGKNSANTLRLAKISRESGTITQHVETPEEIQWEQIANVETLGITAGASTPAWMIKRVAEHVQYLAETRKPSFIASVWRLANLCVNLNLFVSAGAVAMFYFSCVVQGFNFTLRGAFAVFLYFLSMYLWNSLVNADQMRHLGLNRYQFYRAHKKLVWTMAIVCITLVLSVGFQLGEQSFYLVLFLTTAGCVYHFTIVPFRLRKFIRYRTLRDIPSSRDIFVALAWSVLITFLPLTIFNIGGESSFDFFVFAWVFILAFLRSILLDLRDIEGDRIMGRETLVMLIGEKRAGQIISKVLWISLSALLLYSAIGAIRHHDFTETRTLFLIFQIPAILYGILLVKNSHRISINRTVLFTLLADTQFYLAGAGALIAAWL
jgi:4-hydroxy-3-methylbut-2-enyl diphosphate reductase